MAKNTTSATLPVQYGSAGAPGLQLETWNVATPSATGFYDIGQIVVKLALYPALGASDGAKLAAAGGTANFAEKRDRGELYEIIQFNGNDRTQTKYPASKSFIAIPIGAAFDREGNLINPVFSLDPATSEVVASEPCYGGVWVSYITTFRIIDFKPDALVINDNGFVQPHEVMVVWFPPDGSDPKIVKERIGYGSSEENREWTELYRVYSYALISGGGDGVEDVHEIPKNWPDSLSYGAGYPDAPDESEAVAIKRVHEIGRVNAFGLFSRVPNHVRIEQPFTGQFTYDPQYYYEQNPEVKVGDLGIDIAKIKAETAKNYPKVLGL